VFRAEAADMSEETPAESSAPVPERYPDSLIQEISPRDNMFRVRKRYLNSGWRALTAIRLGMAAAGKSDIESALDLPSGHGRVLRWIKAEFPSARLGACDIDHDGVDFCAATFGAEPVYGHADPAAVAIEQPYELIWSGSLFTHLPPGEWPGFLDLFVRALKPGGLVVFTTHGRRIAEVMPDQPEVYGSIDLEQLIRDFEREGAAYREYDHPPAYRERFSLPPAYGISLALPSAVCAVLERQPRLQLVGFNEGGFNRQDVISAVRRAEG
jgi:SAM-dependent methyltransferase